MTYHFLDPSHTDPARIKKERTKARQLKKTHWWRQKVQRRTCELCGQASEELTMDHIVPLARGGASSKGNILAACRKCNQEKGLQTPADLALVEGI